MRNIPDLNNSLGSLTHYTIACITRYWNNYNKIANLNKRNAPGKVMYITYSKNKWDSKNKLEI